MVGRKGNIVPCTLMPGVKTGTFPTRANTQHMHARRTRMHMHACLCFHTCAREPHMHARLYVTICMHMRMSLHQRAFVVALELVCIWVRHLRLESFSTAAPAKGKDVPYEYREQPATCLVIYCHANGVILYFAFHTLPMSSCF